MGGGAATNIFKAKMSDTPREALNWKLWYAVFTFGLMGAARGIDEGLISGTIQQISFIRRYGLDDPDKSADEIAQLTGNITAMVQIGCVGGALIAFLLCDRIGRVWAARELCTIWIVGIVIFLTADGNIGQVYAGRFIAGLGIGQTCVVAPTYLAEVAPRSIRGLCICMFSGSVYLGIMLAYFASWGSAKNIPNGDANQWIVPTTMHIMFAGIILILTIGVYESPRYFIKVGKVEKGRDVMSRIRKLPVEHPYVQTELLDIEDQLNREREATLGAGWFGTIKELFLIPANRYRIHIGILSQLLSQWSGANSVTIYAPEYFALLGIKGQNEKLFATCIFGVVKLVSSLACALFLVDFLGRKRALGCGITLQFVSMLYVAILLSAVPELGAGDAALSGAKKNAATGAIVFIYFSGAGWALGWNSIQYLINAEIFPLRVRALGSSLVMCFHFVNQYGNSKAVPLMLTMDSLKPQGTFWFFAVVTLLGLLWMWLFLPETAGRSLESMDALFSLPWHKIGRKGPLLAAETGGYAEAYHRGDLEKGPIELSQTARVEKVDER
ncbi:MFS quinate transporter [Lineolata rhizophorae]|uniref:MFS quinate transporter n=1 Tax=Lineolata rhizophorae TaxID=578093 RepID=A0A6A6P8M4_9PEZI|nr:MFS quinate transporter [Lineolata rhizophorae]